MALYLGILTEVNKIEKEATHREILRKAKQVNKKYLLEEQLVNIYYNTRSTSLSVVVEQFEMNLTRMLVCELTEVVNYIGPFLSDRPTIRPGQGQLIDFNGRKMKDGTLRWWSYILNRTVQLIQQSRQLNMLTSRQFRQYLYCLMHQYTFGKCKPLTAIIDCY